MRLMASTGTTYTEKLAKRIRAAQGHEFCDVIIKNVTYLDVFTCEWKQGDIAWFEGVIVGVEAGLKAREVIDGSSKFLVPGFIDAHVHVESSLLMPASFQNVVLPKGTTTAISDPHELSNVMGVSGIQFFLDSSLKLDLDLRVMLSSCVPATHFETNGGGAIEADALIKLIDHPQVLGLAEMMNVPGVLNADPKILEKLQAFKSMPMDGHCPLVRGQALSAYASAGISSCHESSEYEEAREKLSKGISVWIREGSVAKDLDALSPLLTLATSTTIGFCSDDRNPLDIEHEGHLDHLIRGAIRNGVAIEVAYRAASWSVARHYGLDRGPNRVGAIAPGYGADLVLLDDARTCSINSVFKSGKNVQGLKAQTGSAFHTGNTIKVHTPEAHDFNGVSGNVNVIGVHNGKILTDHLVLKSDAKNVARFTVLERYGHGSKPSNAYVHGFGENFEGAIASSVGHDSHNLSIVGTSTSDMKVATEALIQSGGGFVVVKNGQVLSSLALPLGGLMSAAEPASIVKSLTHLRDASRSIGCELTEPFLQLAFLSLPVIPSLKLTDKGLVDVNQFKIIPVGV